MRSCLTPLSGGTTLHTPLQSSLSRFAGTFQCEWVLLCSCAIFPYSYYYLHAFLVVSLWINNVEVSDKTKISFRVLLDLTLYILVFRVGQNVPTFVQVYSPHNHYSCLCASTSNYCPTSQSEELNWCDFNIRRDLCNDSLRMSSFVSLCYFYFSDDCKCWSKFKTYFRKKRNMTHQVWN